MTLPALIDLPYDTGTVILVAVIVLVTTAISAVAGFGFGTIAVPTLLLVLSPAATVTLSKVVGAGTGWIVLLSIWRSTRWSTILRILPAAVVGLVLGGYILASASPAAIQLFVGVLVLVSAVTLVVRPILIARDTVWATSLVGFLTGVMGNATGLLAPAVVVYFTGRRFPKDVFRATTLSLFLVVELVGLPTLLAQGAISIDDVLFTAMFLPAAIAGRLGGLRLARHVSAERFRALVIALLFLIAVTSIVTGLGELGR